MPDHIHLIIVPSEKNISECMKSIKGFSARQINRLLDRAGSIWQEAFYDHILDTEEKVVHKIKYIEENPERKGIVTHAEDYEYSAIKYRDQTDFNLFF
jgi:REP element-mobilizing transposase RayT